MGTTNITRSLHFDAAHRVLQHKGKCAHLHGHRYTVNITIQQETMDMEKNAGMVVDFGLIKDEWGTFLDLVADHGVILEDNDPLVDSLPAIDEGVKIWILPYPATAEGISRCLYELWSRSTLLNDDCLLQSVEVWETPNCSGRYAE